MKNLLLFVLTASVSLHASVFTGTSLSVESEKTTPAGDTEETLRYGEIPVTVVYRTAPKEELVSKTEELLSTIAAWKHIRPGAVKIFFAADDSIETGLQNVQIESPKGNYTSHVPSGINLSWNGTLVYAFRVHSQNLFVKVKSYYESEQEILKKIEDAAENPERYLKTRDPEFMAEQIEDLREKNEELKAAISITRRGALYGANTGFFSGPKEVPQESISLLVNYASENPKLSIKEISKYAKSKGAKLSDKEIRLILALYLNWYEN